MDTTLVTIEFEITSDNEEQLFNIVSDIKDSINNANGVLSDTVSVVEPDDLGL